MKKLLFFISLLVYNNSYAFDLNGPMIANKEVMIGIHGKFDTKSYTQLKDALDGYKDRTVYIYANSTGGAADQIIEIMDLIHQYDIVWIVDDKAICQSACALSASGAKVIHGNLEYHNITWNDTGKQNVTLNNKAKEKLTSYGFKHPDKLLESDQLKKVLFN